MFLEIFSIQGLDLISVGLATAAIVILGFVAFFSSPQSVTNRTFLAFSILAACWSGLNYLTYQSINPALVIWILRVAVFFAVWYSFMLFRLFYVFPEDRVIFPKFYKFGLVPMTVLISLLVLTQFVFSEPAEFSEDGRLVATDSGPGIFLFAFWSVLLVFGGIYIVTKKMLRASGVSKTQLKFVFLGTLITYSLIIIFNLVFPAFLKNSQFISLGAVFTFPFVVFTTYAIMKHHLLNVKVIATEILMFVLATVTLFEVLFSDGVGVLLFRVVVFSLVLAFGILLIKSVRREVTQRQKLEELTKELSAANIRLQELDKLKSQFLSFASHQIKAPMTVVKGYASMIYDGTYGQVGEKVREVSQKIVRSANTMIALVNNLLDLRRLDEGKMEYTFEVTKVAALVSDVVEGLRPLAEEKGLALSFKSEAPEAQAKLDAQKFNQVIQNLVDNAVKYTERGNVDVRVYFSDDAKKEIKIAVKDTGYGIGPDLLPNLFEQFERGLGAAKKIRGTGLGLYIARQMIRAHGGEVTAESRGEGLGSIFTVTLPAINAAGADQAVIREIRASNR